MRPLRRPARGTVQVQTAIHLDSDSVAWAWGGAGFELQYSRGASPHLSSPLTFTHEHGNGKGLGHKPEHSLCPCPCLLYVDVLYVRILSCLFPQTNLLIRTHHTKTYTSLKSIKIKLNKNVNPLNRLRKIDSQAMMRYFLNLEIIFFRSGEIF